MDKYLQKPFQGFKEIVINRFYNHQHPENRNIEYPNKKENLVKYYTETGWKYDKFNNKKDEIIYSTKDIMHNHYLDQNTQERIKNDITNYNNYKQFHENNDKYLGEDIKIILLNNRINNKKLLFDNINIKKLEN